MADEQQGIQQSPAQPTPPAQTPPPPPPTQQTPQAGKGDIEENKIFAIIAYLGILFLVPLLAKKDSPFAMYHAKQGMVLFITDIVLYIIAIPISIFTWGFGYGIISILLLILWIMGIINAANGQTKPLPIIGQYAEKIKI